MQEVKQQLHLSVGKLHGIGLDGVGKGRDPVRIVFIEKLISFGIQSIEVGA